MLFLYAVTLFAGAYLLFLVEPMAAKMVLPLLGGAPAVWAASLVFFQAALLAGYAYAHWAPARLGLRRHALVHVAVLLAAALALPVGLGAGSPSVEHPVAWLLRALAVGIGLPFFAVAATAPLLQRWFAGTGHEAGADPYFLYAASNAGSLAALASYPTVVEPALLLSQQSRVWSWAYGGLVALTGACALALLLRPPSPDTPRSDTAASDGRIRGAAGVWRRLRWLGWAFVPSSLMVGVTTFVTTDVAPIPLLWVAPLAVYLLTFIIAFARPPAWLHGLAVALLPLTVVALAATGVSRPAFETMSWTLEIGPLIALHLAALFVVGLVCHGELARDRPGAADLTEFYLWVSTGGALGGVFNALIAPYIFDRIVEYPLVAALACALRPGIGEPRARQSVAGTIFWEAFGVACGALIYAQSAGPLPEEVLLRERNFFGVLTVRRHGDFVQMVHGTTTHGMQCRAPGYRDQPLTYFTRSGPLGQLMAALPHAKGRVAVIGLGAGTVACYAGRGDDWDFYEIDPAVERVARDTEYFTFLSDAEARGATLRVVLGDGRLKLAETERPYDLIIIDAFSSDSIPIHLLTREALQLYLAKLAPGGVIAFHLSNNYLRLAPVVGRLADDLGLACLTERDFDESAVAKFPSRWAVVARRPQVLAALTADRRWRRPAAAGRAWTDDYSNLLSVFVWDQRAEYRREFASER